MTKPNQAETRRFYARPTDRSFEAYREFILGMTAALGGENDATEDELREGWRRFWEAANPDAAIEDANEEGA